MPPLRFESHHGQDEDFELPEPVLLDGFHLQEIVLDDGSYFFTPPRETPFTHYKLSPFKSVISNSNATQKDLSGCEPMDTDLSTAIAAASTEDVRMQEVLITGVHTPQGELEHASNTDGVSHADQRTGVLESEGDAAARKEGGGKEVDQRKGETVGCLEEVGGGVGAAVTEEREEEVDNATIQVATASVTGGAAMQEEMTDMLKNELKRESPTVKGSSGTNPIKAHVQGGDGVFRSSIEPPHRGHASPLHLVLPSLALLESRSSGEQPGGHGTAAEEKAAGEKAPGEKGDSGEEDAAGEGGAGNTGAAGDGGEDDGSSKSQKDIGGKYMSPAQTITSPNHGPSETLRQSQSRTRPGSAALYIATYTALEWARFRFQTSLLGLAALYIPRWYTRICLVEWFIKLVVLRG
ncbi:unnamed protein product [Closterium sp. NIES-65]|nr:unnamed protein product [Closterium sp. NIES-65]